MSADIIDDGFGVDQELIPLPDRIELCLRKEVEKVDGLRLMLFELSHSLGREIAGELQIDGRRATFTPMVPLKPGTKYGVLLQIERVSWINSWKRFDGHHWTFITEPRIVNLDLNEVNKLPVLGQGAFGKGMLAIYSASMIEVL